MAQSAGEALTDWEGVYARVTSTATVSMDPDGFTGGVNAGYNWQMDRVVMGLETDIAYTDFEDSNSHGAEYL